MKQFIKSIWNKRYMNSAERYKQKETQAKIACTILAVLLCVLFFSMCYWSV